LGGTTVAINVGDGDDSVSVDDDFVAQTTNVRTDIVLGAGTDEVEIEYGENIYDSDEADFEDGLVSVGDFAVGAHVLDISLVGDARDTLTNIELSDIADEANLYDAVTVAATYTTAGDFSAFNFDGNAYIYFDQDTTGTFTDGDGLIELVGVSVSQMNGTNFVVV